MNNKAKIQELYSIRNEIFNKIDSMPVIPEEVQKIIYRAFIILEEHYNKYGLDNSEIIQYLYGNYEETKDDINKRSGNDRRGVYWKQISDFFDYLEERISKGEEIQQSYVENIEFTDDKKNSIVNTIVGTLNDKLKDVQNKQNKLMETRGFTDEEIENVYNKIMTLIRKFISENESYINHVYQRREEKLSSEVKNKILERIDKLNFTERTQEERFKEGVSIDLPLEEQRENVQRFTDTQIGSNRNKKDGSTPPRLPNDLIQ